MKNTLLGGWFFTSAIAVVCLAGGIPSMQAQPAAPMPPLAPAALDAPVALPPNIPPDGPLAQVVKLVQAGVDIEVIKTFIINSANPFNLDAQAIITLNDLGVPTEIIDVMMEHDKQITLADAAASVTPPPPPPPPPAPATVIESSVFVAPPPPVDVQYFNNTLSPYGNWVVVEGYGRCWRPTTVVYDAGWQPYCDRGRWVYSDCGWYWDSDYSWGVTFHYGRWFRNDRYGWCWWPDTVWAPSWVTWRQSDAYCGWAPLPPYSTYRPGVGFFYRDSNVSIGFDFGISASCYTFVSFGHFCDPHPRYYREPAHQVTQIYNQTTVINNYNYNSGHNNNGHGPVIVNGGVSVDRVRRATHNPIQQVAVGQLPNSRRQGWRGENPDQSPRRLGNSPSDQRAGANGVSTSSGPAGQDGRNNPANANHVSGGGQANPSPSRSANINSPAQAPSPGQPDNRNVRRDQVVNNRNASPAAAAPQNPAPATSTPVTRVPGGNDRIQSQDNRHLQPSQVTPANNVRVQNPAPTVNSQPAPATPFIRQQPVQSTQPRYNQPAVGNDRCQSQNNRIQQPSQVTPANNSVYHPGLPPRTVTPAPQPPAASAPPRNNVAPASPAPSQAPAQSQPRSSNSNPQQSGDRDKPRR